MKKKTCLPLGIAVVAAAAWLLLRRQSDQPSQFLYTHLAGFYDRLFGATYDRARRRTVQLLALKPGERLLISGAGTGLDLPMIGAGVEVDAVDISPDMLAVAAAKPAHARVRLTQMDAQNLEFPAQTFDAALLNLIVSVAPDGRAVFAEAWRTLKPGGRLVLFDKFLPEGHSAGLMRRLAGAFFNWIGTDINRRLSDVVGDLPDGTVELNEASLFFGQYRILRIRKTAGL